jgi:pimeloyl-ACP methyl ester carboxylesterase
MDSADDNGFLVRTISAKDGLQLYAREYGGDNPETTARAPVVCLPGLTRNSRDFHRLAMVLSRDRVTPRRVITLDARGRGQSAWDDDKRHYNVVVEAEDVIVVCTALGIHQAAFIGTSRGGLVLHMLATSRPQLLKAVIFNDIGPVLETEGLADIRDYLNRERKPRDRREAVDILRENHGASFTALSEEDWQEMASAIYRFGDGNVVADFDPAIALQMKTLDLTAPLPDLWPQFAALQSTPVMVIRGENSRLLSSFTVAEMARRHPDLIVKPAVGQGHAPILHLGDIPEAIRRFLEKV